MNAEPKLGVEAERSKALMAFILKVQLIYIFLLSNHQMLGIITVMTITSSYNSREIYCSNLGNVTLRGLHS